MANGPSRAFTVRLPETLVEQIEQRARFTKRSRTAEVEHLLEWAIDEIIRKERVAG